MKQVKAIDLGNVVDTAKEAAEILIKAEEIKQNAELMALVKTELGKKKKTINSIEALRELANGKPSDEEESEEVEEDVEPKPELERSDEMGDVIAEQDESRVQIQGPARGVIATKKKEK
jgi:hypothetical protein